MIPIIAVIVVQPKSTAGPTRVTIDTGFVLVTATLGIIAIAVVG